MNCSTSFPVMNCSSKNCSRKVLLAGDGLVRTLVLAINRFYDPDFSDRQREPLLLWQSHRYDVRAPAAFVSCRDLSHQQLRIEGQRYADWVEAWLPVEQQTRRSFALVATVDGRDIALLEIDRELFLTLLEAQRGSRSFKLVTYGDTPYYPFYRPDRPGRTRDRGRRRGHQGSQRCD